nr:hypothetical protein [Kitasatospora sp. SID7827]
MSSVTYALYNSARKEMILFDLLQGGRLRIPVQNDSAGLFIAPDQTDRVTRVAIDNTTGYLFSWDLIDARLSRQYVGKSQRPHSDYLFEAAEPNGPTGPMTTDLDLDRTRGLVAAYYDEDGDGRGHDAVLMVYGTTDGKQRAVVTLPADSTGEIAVVPGTDRIYVTAPAGPDTLLHAYGTDGTRHEDLRLPGVTDAGSFVTDPGTGDLYFYGAKDGTGRLLTRSAADGTVRAVTGLTGHPNDVVIDDQARLAYVLTTETTSPPGDPSPSLRNRVAVVDLATRAVLADTPIEQHGLGLDFDPQTHLVYAGGRRGDLYGITTLQYTP